MIVPMVVTRLLRRGVKLYPGKTFCVDGERRYTYSQYQERVNRLSNALVGLGVAKGDRVAVLAPNCHELLEAYFGVVQVGAILLCLNIRLASSELAYILNHAEASILLVDAELLPLIEPVKGDLRSVKRTVVVRGECSQAVPEALEYEQLLSSQSIASPSVEISENDVAEMFYTSGTTGRPKGVMLTHRNLYANALSWINAVGLTDQDVHLHSVPLFHVNGWGTPHAVTAVGGTHVLLRQFRAADVFTAIEKEGVTIGAMVPAMLNSLLNDGECGSLNLGTWRKLILGGAPAPSSFVVAAKERFGVECIVGYGMTEACPLMSMANVKYNLMGLPLETLNAYRCKTGLEVLGVELRVVDGAGQDVPRDGKTIGEIIARGDNVMLGYWRDEEATRRTIVEGWLRTGDLATIDEECYIQIVDRQKDIIITGGENVGSAEIEMVLYQHPAILEAAVIGVPDPKWGEVPKALIVIRPGFVVTESEIVEFCVERLAKFKLPKIVEFVDSLPKTATGKLQKNLVRERYGKAE